MKIIIIIFIFILTVSYNNCSSKLEIDSDQFHAPVTLMTTSRGKVKIGDTIVNATLASLNKENNNEEISVIEDTGIALWPRSEFKFIFDKSVTDQSIKDNFKKACQLWSKTPGTSLNCIDTEIGPERPHALLIKMGSVSTDCYTDLGFVTNGEMILGSSCANLSKLLHLIGHSLGLIDEHLRIDRDSYVKIPTQDKLKINFVKLVQHRKQNLESYNYFSVMHHPFVGDFIPVETSFQYAANNKSINTIGDLAVLSSSDQKYIQQMYPNLDNEITDSNPNCSKTQFVSWGSCYSHIVPGNGESYQNGTILTVYNENTFFSLSRSVGRFKCVSGYWTAESTNCVKDIEVPVDSGTPQIKCPSGAVVSWRGLNSTNVCSQTIQLTQDANPGTLTALSMRANASSDSTKGQDVGFAVFKCENGNWNYQSEIREKFNNNSSYNYTETYKSSKKSYCITNSSNKDECPLGTSYTWTSSSGTCQGVLKSSALGLGQTTVLQSENGTTGNLSVVCKKTLSGMSLDINYDGERTAAQIGDCGQVDGSSNLTPIKITPEIVASVCLKNAEHPVISWSESGTSTCEIDLKQRLDRNYYLGEFFTVRSGLNSNSFNSIATFKCVAGDTNKGTGGTWVLATGEDISNSNNNLPSHQCRKMCFPNTSSVAPYVWYKNNESNGGTGVPVCWGNTDVTYSYIEGETVLINNSNGATTSDSMASYICGPNDNSMRLNLISSSSTNKCEWTN